MFSCCGEIVQVRILRPGNPTSGDVKKYLAANPHLDGRVCAFVEFESTDLAQKAVAELSESNHYNLEVFEYSEPPATKKDDRAGREMKKNKKKSKTELKLTGAPSETQFSWRTAGRETHKWTKGVEDLEAEGGEDDIGYSSDNEVIDNSEWTNLVNRTVAMVFEEV